MTSEVFSERIVSMIQTLYRVSYSMLARPCDREDAVQEALKKAWQKRDSLREERYMQTWVIRILINECRNIQSRSKRERARDEFAELAAPPDADSELHDALTALEGKLRLPVVLHYIEGYSVDEIAAMLRLPSGTVKSRMAKARKLLKNILSEEASAT